MCQTHALSVCAPSIISHAAAGSLALLGAAELVGAASAARTADIAPEQ